MQHSRKNEKKNTKLETSLSNFSTDPTSKYAPSTLEVIYMEGYNAQKDSAQ